MSINQRVRELRNFLKLGRAAFSAETGLPKKTIENIENENQRMNGEQVEAICKRYPEFSNWLTTGEVKNKLQISPETEEIRKKL